MKRSALYGAVLAAVAVLAPAHAQGKSIAVMPSLYFSAEPQSAGNITTGLAQQFERQGYSVTPASQSQQAFTALGLEPTRHYADSAALRFGRQVGAQLVAYPRLLVPLGALDPVIAAPLSDAGLTPYHAIKSALPLLTPDSTVVVIGLGGLGQMAVQICARSRRLASSPATSTTPSSAARVASVSRTPSTPAPAMRPKPSARSQARAAPRWPWTSSALRTRSTSALASWAATAG